MEPLCFHSMIISVVIWKEIDVLDWSVYTTIHDWIDYKDGTLSYGLMISIAQINFSTIWLLLENMRLKMKKTKLTIKLSFCLRHRLRQSRHELKHELKHELRHTCWKTSWDNN